MSTCVHCGGTLRIVASIEEPTAIRVILAHFEKHGAREKRTTDPPRARRPLSPRDIPPATTPKAKPVRPHEAATNPQSRARPAAGNRREWPPTAMRRGPAMPKSDSRTSDPRPIRRLRDHRLLANFGEKGV